MKIIISTQKVLIACIAVCLILIVITSCKKDNDDNEVIPIVNIPSWMHGEYISQDSVHHFMIESDSINTIGGLKYLTASAQVLERSDVKFQFISGNGCTHTFMKDGGNIKYNVKLPGEPGPITQVGSTASIIAKGVLKIIKIIVNNAYAKNAPGVAVSDSRLYVLIKYSGSEYSVSSTEFLPDGSVSDVAADWATAEDAVGSEGSGISYSNRGYIHLVKGGLAEVRSYYASDIDQGVSGDSHLSTGVATYPSDPDTYGDYTYLLDGGSQKKIYIGKFYPDHNKDKVDKVRIFDNGGSLYVKGLCLSSDGKMLFITHSVETSSQNYAKAFGLSCYKIDATNDEGAKSFSKIHESTKSHNYECWPMACDCDGTFLYVLMKDYNGDYKYYVAIYQMDLSDTDFDWIPLADYLQPGSDFEPSDLVVRGDYIYISNGKKDGDDGLKVLQLQMQDETVRKEVGAHGLNRLREARLNGLEWSLEKK